MSADIIDSLAKISISFQELGFKPPAAILLADHDEGMRLLSELHQMARFTIPLGGERGGYPIEAPDGSVCMQVEVYGMKVRWPAQRLAFEGGRDKWV